MQNKGYRTYSTVRNPREIVLVTGQDVKVRVRREQIEITDGFPLSAPQETRRITRAVDRVERILVLAGSGFATLSALDFAAENGAPIIACDQGGHLRWVLLPGEGGQWKTKLRRAQAAALHEPAGLDVGRFLIEAKLQAQAEVVRRVLAGLGTRTGAVIRNAAEMLERLRAESEKAPNVERLRFIESRGAETYWSTWVGFCPSFAPASYARTVPVQWKMFRSRHSPLQGGHGPKDAMDPVNVLLNYGYALLEAEAKIACHAAGLDPALGLLHSDRDARLSFIYDLMEPCRLVVDRLVLELVASHAFRRGELWALRDGRCRLDQEFAAGLRGWLPILRRALEPVIARVETLLRRGYRERDRQHPAHKATRIPETGACPECGSPVRPGRRFCSAACYQVWWKANVQTRISREGNETLARLRAEGHDPAHSGEATKKRAASVSRVKCREWMMLTPKERRRRTRPANLARWHHTKSGEKVKPLRER
jgi:CRISP-associated protein Cas1